MAKKKRSRSSLDAYEGGGTLLDISEGAADGDHVRKRKRKGGPENGDSEVLRDDERMEKEKKKKKKESPGPSSARPRTRSMSSADADGTEEEKFKSTKRPRTQSILSGEDGGETRKKAKRTHEESSSDIENQQGSKKLSEEEAKKKAEQLRQELLKLKELKKKKKTKNKMIKEEKEKKHVENTKQPEEKAEKVPEYSNSPKIEGAAKVEDSEFNPYLAHLTDEIERQVIRGDSRLEGTENKWERKRNAKMKRAFHILPQGTFVKEAEAQRSMDARKDFLRDWKNPKKREEFRQKLAKEMETVGPDAFADLVEMKEAPEIEWWDIPYAKPASAPIYGMLSIGKQKTFKLVERPCMLDPLVPEQKSEPLPVFLTKEERKKMRKQARREKQQEIQDKIAAGLIPPPPPKVKLSNMMRILGEKAILDPSKIEAEVRKQRDERIKDHEMRNLANKKTPQEKWDNKLVKVAMDSQGPPQVAVFRVDTLTKPPATSASNRFKIKANAEKLCLSGLMLIVEELAELEDGTKKPCNLVIVEGGQKRLRKFEKQMMQRIKWDPNGDLGNKCVKVWEGSVSRKAFHDSFTVYEAVSGEEARAYLEENGIGHFWSLALNC